MLNLRVGFSLPNPLTNHMKNPSPPTSMPEYVDYSGTGVITQCRLFVFVKALHTVSVFGLVQIIWGSWAMYFPETFSSLPDLAGHNALLCQVLLAPPKNLYLMNQFVLHPFFLQPPLPTTPHLSKGLLAGSLFLCHPKEK